MKPLIIAIFLTLVAVKSNHAQEVKQFPLIQKQKLLQDLELLHQALDQLHSGMYWYSNKDSVDLAFERAKILINRDMNVMEFHKIMAPLVALSREDHTDIFLPTDIEFKQIIRQETQYFPLVVVFLGEEMYCFKNASTYDDMPLEGQKITSINGQTPQKIVENIGQLFASDGYIKRVKYSDLDGFAFARYFYYYYGNVDQFEIEVASQENPIILQANKIEGIRRQLKQRYAKTTSSIEKDPLEFKILKDSIAYIGVHDFSNGYIRKQSEAKSLKRFLGKSFEQIKAQNIATVIVDVSENGGGSEGNEGLLYSYFGDNYQKYHKVRANRHKVVLDNGKDKPIKIKNFGFFEKLLINKKMEDGSYERREGIGMGLKAYKKTPKYKFKGKTYVIISPVTYSGASEFSNMMYSQGLATFVGQETGGGYLGNTSGYGKKLVLPHSKITVKIPTLQFIMNVKPLLPKGRGVIPYHEVIPTYEQYVNGENAPLTFILEELVGKSDE